MVELIPGRRCSARNAGTCPSSGWNRIRSSRDVSNCEPHQCLPSRRAVRARVCQARHAAQPRHALLHRRALMWSLLLCGVQMRQSSNFSSRSAATPHKLSRGTRRSKRCTTSTPRRRRGFLEGAMNRKQRYPLGCNRRASERMTTVNETYFTNVVCVKCEYAPCTHESFYVK
jgi:hypothetical protein